VIPEISISTEVIPGLISVQAIAFYHCSLYTLHRMFQIECVFAQSAHYFYSRFFKFSFEPAKTDLVFRNCFSAVSLRLFLKELVAF